MNFKIEIYTYLKILTYHSTAPERTQSYRKKGHMNPKDLNFST